MERAGKAQSKPSQGYLTPPQPQRRRRAVPEEEQIRPILPSLQHLRFATEPPRSLQGRVQTPLSPFGFEEESEESPYTPEQVLKILSDPKNTIKDPLEAIEVVMNKKGWEQVLLKLYERVNTVDLLIGFIERFHDNALLEVLDTNPLLAQQKALILAELTDRGIDDERLHNLIISFEPSQS
ncbi:MAG: hypothetical protein SNF33_01600 [Candidatus Algichlamydia australiensis]|nr:hypothetical protein [Chlamydiales bacterium]